MVNVNELNVQRALDELDPNPPNVELPTLDNKTLVWVYPVDPAWLSPEVIAFRADAVAINAATFDVQDDNSGTAITFDVGDLPNFATEGRYYTAIQVTLAGAAVTPITINCAVQYRDAGGTLRTYQVTAEDCTNPGQVFFGPVYCPVRSILRVNSTVNGGAGDTATIRIQGLTHQLGVPVPLIPGGRQQSR